MRISVINGNLGFVRHPLMLGHYRSMALTGSEMVVDRLIGGKMQAALDVRRYPDRPKANQIFPNMTVDPGNPLQVRRPQAVIVVGLGDEGKLTASDLTATVAEGVVAWEVHMSPLPESTPGGFELASTLMGSGGTG